MKKIKWTRIPISITREKREFFFPNVQVDIFELDKAKKKMTILHGVKKVSKVNYSLCSIAVGSFSYLGSFLNRLISLF